MMSRREVQKKFQPGMMVISKRNLRLSMIVGYSAIPPVTNRHGRETSPASWEALVLSSVGDIKTVHWFSLDQEYYSTVTWEGFKEQNVA